MSNTRRYPTITGPCLIPLDLDYQAKRGFCSACNKHVHHLDALSDAEYKSLFTAGKTVCVSYPVRVAAFGALAALTMSAAVMAGDDPSESTLQMVAPEHQIEIRTRGVVAMPRATLEPLFEESADEHGEGGEAV
jgi:hypothetical protein